MLYCRISGRLWVAATSQNEHSFFSERPQSLSQIQVMLWVQFSLHGKLDHRDVRFRIHEHERNPRTMIEPPRRVGLRDQSGMHEQCRGLFGQCRIAC